MISIRESVAELERSHQLRHAILECYVTAIRGVAHYAIDLEEKITGPHRRHLEALADEVAADAPGALAESRATLRGLLRDYRDKAAAFIGNLRQELANSASALEDILKTLSESDGDSEGRLRVSIGSLRELAASPQAGPIRTAMFAAVDSIEASVEQMRKQHDLTISQFQVEIHMLHRRIDELETAVMVDNLSRLLSKTEMEARIRASGEEWFSLLLLRASGLRNAENLYDAGVAAELAGAFGKRLRNCLPPDAAIGRWSNEEFIAKVTLEKREAVTAARGITQNLSGAYSCIKDGKTVRPTLHVNVAVLDRQPGEPVDRTFARIREFFKG